jgi:hypothetical protein
VNLSSIANSVITSVTPNLFGAVRVSTGYTTEADGTRTPTMQTFPNISMQVQALSGADLKQMDNLDLQAVVRAVYLNGTIEGLDRPAGKGGDIILFNNQVWLVTQVLEPWDAGGWCKVAVTLQNGS